MRTDAENRAKILGSIRDMSRAQVELHKLLGNSDLSEWMNADESLARVMNNAKLLVQDAKDKLNTVNLGK